MRIYPTLAALAALLGLTLGAARAQEAPAAPAKRDWKASPAIVDQAAPKRIIVVGDIHGDYERAVELLARTGVIAGIPATPAEVHWAAGAAILVCTGDLIDKYSHSLEVIALFRALQIDAAKAGGEVIVTLGNHEAEFLAGGGANKKGAEFEAELVKAKISPADVAAGRDVGGIGAWLRALPAAARLGEWFFCHAGDTGGLTFAELADGIQTGVDAEGFGAPILVGPTSLLEARLHPHPWREGGEHAKRSHKKHPIQSGTLDSSMLESEIVSVGAKHLVMGHQPGKVTFADGTERPADTMFTKLDGLIYFVDCGMSRGVDGAVGAILDLDLVNKTSTARYADGRAEVLVK